MNAKKIVVEVRENGSGHAHSRTYHTTVAQAEEAVRAAEMRKEEEEKKKKEAASPRRAYLNELRHWIVQTGSTIGFANALNDPPEDDESMNSHIEQREILLEVLLGEVAHRAEQARARRIREEAAYQERIAEAAEKIRWSHSPQAREEERRHRLELEAEGRESWRAWLERLAVEGNAETGERSPLPPFLRMGKRGEERLARLAIKITGAWQATPKILFRGPSRAFFPRGHRNGYDPDPRREWRRLARRLAPAY